ncbi:MAG: S-layer homology domain-containing protein [Butyricicoccus sp.]|nr:S-layer homology domain-containing protein [Butyricicoccus sp.]
MKKRLVSLLLALMLAVGMLPAGAMAADDTEGPERITAAVPDADAPLTLSQRSAPATITSAEDLAALAEAVNGGESCEGQTVTLATDITLTGEWTPIGTAESPFSGTFDGGYHVISGLNVNASTDNAGLFGYLSAEGTIKNLVVEGEVNASADNAGGIVGTAYGAVLNCGNYATVTGTGNASVIGGIAGMSYAEINNCFNAGNVSGYSNVGGIVGATMGPIDSCYNVGAVSGDGCIGGIAGQNPVNDIVDSYTAGTVTGQGDEVWAFGHSIGWAENSYYLEGSANENPDFGRATAVTISELAALAGSLGEAFEDGDNGYPVLAWEGNVLNAPPAPKLTVKVTFAVTPANAEIRVQDKDNYNAPVSANDDGSYTVTLGGHYYYGIFAEGYVYVEELDFIADGNRTITVELEKQGSAVVTPEPTPTEPDEDDPIREHRESALANLKEQFDKYVESDYTAGNWAKLVAAYEKGVAAIKAARPAEAPYIENNIIAALNAAIAAMQDVKSDPAGTVTVAVSVDANTLGLGYIIKPALVEIPRNTQASVVITDLLKKNGYSYDYTGRSIEDGFYLEGIEPVDQTEATVAPFIVDAMGGESEIWYGDRSDDFLGEFDYCNMSGWMYSVNGSFPGVGAASWNMGDGEVMRWQFTVYGYGADLNADNSTWGASSIIPTLGNKDELTWAVAGLRAEKSDAELEKSDAYKKAMEVLQDPAATQSQIDAAYDALDDLDSGSGGDSSESGSGNDVTRNPPTDKDEYGNANVTMGEQDIFDIIDQAKDEKADRIVIEPKVDGEAGKVSVELPKSAVGDIVKDTGAALSVRTDAGTVTIPAAGLEELNRQSGSKVTISAEALKGEDGKASGETRIEVAVDSRAVEKISGGITVAVPAAETGSGSVLVLVKADGTEEIVKKSVLDGKMVAGIVNGSCTVKVVDNSRQFDDTAGHWGSDAAAFASSHELFGGTGENTFSPDASMSRAMLATVLYRLEGAAANGSNPFDDVPEDTWYADAVTWAGNAGIVTGTGSGFDPNGDATREQLAAMLYRYAMALGMSTAASGDLTGFSDGGKTSDWAKDAMSWAVGSGLISGRDNGALDPTGTATRAEVAVIMQRLIGLMVK